MVDMSRFRMGGLGGKEVEQVILDTFLTLHTHIK